MFGRKKIVIAGLLLLSLWGGGRLYYAVTDGFAMSNIHYTLPFELRRDVTHRYPEKQDEAFAALDQKYRYLGKGCQSYVFESEDGRYVLKFFKYQRYRPQRWLESFTWIPGVAAYSQERLDHKREKLAKLFKGWQTAYEELPEETGLLFVKLSENGEPNKKLTFYDKIGLEHEVDLGEMQFLVQYKADMLSATIEKLLQEGEREKTRLLIGDLIELFLGEYERGYADFDPAIIQNTGVLNGKPIHVDVGQITYSDTLFNPQIWKQDLFNKTYKFRAWLRELDKELAAELDNQLQELIGSDFDKMVKTY